MICKNENLIVWRRTQETMHLAARCAHCDGVGSILTHTFERIDCTECYGQGWFGIRPESAATADPGSVEKVAVLGVRYAAGLPLWNGRDRCAAETVAAEEAGELPPKPRKSRRNGPAKKRGKRHKARKSAEARKTNSRSKRSASLAP